MAFESPGLQRETQFSSNTKACACQPGHLFSGVKFCETPACDWQRGWFAQAYQGDRLAGGWAVCARLEELPLLHLISAEGEQQGHGEGPA